MIESTTQNRPAAKRSWAIRAIYVIGAIAVTIAILWQTGLISKEWWDKAPAPKPVAVAKAPPQTPTNAIGIAPPTPKGNDSSVSQVPLQLILVQVHPGRSANEGSAEIGVVRASPQTYQAGALLENGSRLAEIHTDYVLLQRGGRAIRMYLGDAATARKTSDAALLTVGGVKQVPQPAGVTSRDSLTDYIRPSPVYDGESIIGYQVFPGAKSGPFYQMGLRPGDLIVALDGSALNDQTSAWAILHQLTEGSVLSAVVKRSNRVEQVTLDGAPLVRAEEYQTQGSSQAMLAPVAN